MDDFAGFMLPKRNRVHSFFSSNWLYDFLGSTTCRRGATEVPEMIWGVVVLPENSFEQQLAVGSVVVGGDFS